MNIIRFVERLVIVMKKGRYSLEYINFYRKNFGLYPFNPCLKNCLNYYLVPFFRKPAISLKTSNEIRFGEINFGISFNELFKMKGVPNCFSLEPVDDEYLKAIRYNEMVLKSKMNVTYFFLREIFFMGEYRFGDTTFLDIPETINTLSKKFDVEIPPESEEFLIEDGAGNAVHYLFNGIAVSIRYFCGKDPVIGKIIETYLNRTDQINAKEDDLGSVLSGHF